MIADESANDDNEGSGDEHVVRPRLDFSHAERGADGQNNQADD